jgi:hypothetical protein
MDELTEDFTDYRIVYDDIYLDSLFLNKGAWVKTPMLLYTNGINYKLFIPFNIRSESLYIRTVDSKTKMPVILTRTRDD